MPVDLVAFGIILDDLVLPDGLTTLGLLGGGGPQTAFGMRLPALAGWTADSYSVGLVSGVGRDLPASARAWLDALGVDLQGLRVGDWPTARAWQLLGPDGRRLQRFRVPGAVVGAQLGRSLDRLPESYRQARGFHLGIHPDDPDLDFLARLRELAPRAPLISVEPFRPADRPPAGAALGALCRACDIFSPNLEEAQSLVGDGTPEVLARRLSGAGAAIVALRLGDAGSLVASGEQAFWTPAVPVRVVDPTGAGNAYCGAFLAGYLQTGDLARAARYAAVAASFLVEQVGLPAIMPGLAAEANRRLDLLRHSMNERRA